MEYGTKYCHHSPRLDEEKLHMAILAAINGFAAVEQKICPAVQQLAENARPGLAATGTSLMSMKRRIQENGREQNELLDCLLENMNNAEPNAKMQTLSDEQQTPKGQVEAA